MTEERLESGRYLRALTEHWPYIAGTIALAVAAAVFFVYAADKRYEAGADVLVTPVPSDTFVGVPLFRESDISRSVVAAARIAKSPQIIARAKQRLGFQGEREELLGHVAVAPQEQSSILTITGKVTTAAEAARIANTFADVLIAERTAQLQREVRLAIARLSGQLAEVRARAADSEQAAALAQRLSDLRTLVGARDPTLQIVSRAVPPESQVWPRPVLSVAVALLAGLLLGMGIAVALEVVNPLVLTESDVLERAAPPILARVPWVPDNRVRRDLLRSSTTLPRSALAYRALWGNLAAQRESRHAPETIAFTSTAHDEGKSSTAIGLCVAVALTGMNVILIDADASHGASSRLVAGPPDEGRSLRAALVGDLPLDRVLRATDMFGDRLRILAAHPGDETLLMLVSPERLASLVDELKAIADVIVFDTPPMAGSPDALIFAEATEAVVVTVRLGHTRREQLREVRRDLDQRGIALAGFVIVGRRRRRRRADRARIDIAKARSSGADLSTRPAARESTAR